VEPDQLLPRSHLFTIRLWTESLGDGQVSRRGRVQYVLSGERRFFKDWTTLVEYLEAKMKELDSVADFDVVPRVTDSERSV
jgi:hypothetical protein